MRVSAITGAGKRSNHGKVRRGKAASKGQTRRREARPGVARGRQPAMSATQARKLAQAGEKPDAATAARSRRVVARARDGDGGIGGGNSAAAEGAMAVGGKEAR
ncbi:hypothetical protein U1Q18_038099, partial [Sarracenia purpurea var. burkii]